MLEKAIDIVFKAMQRNFNMALGERVTKLDHSHIGRLATLCTVEVTYVDGTGFHEVTGIVDIRRDIYDDVEFMVLVIGSDDNWVNVDFYLKCDSYAYVELL
jgi:hypothetical protein